MQLEHASHLNTLNEVFLHVKIVYFICHVKSLYQMSNDRGTINPTFKQPLNAFNYLILYLQVIISLMFGHCCTNTRLDYSVRQSELLYT